MNCQETGVLVSSSNTSANELYFFEQSPDVAYVHEFLRSNILMNKKQKITF